MKKVTCFDKIDERRAETESIARFVKDFQTTAIANARQYINKSMIREAYELVAIGALEKGVDFINEKIIDDLVSELSGYDVFNVTPDRALDKVGIDNLYRNVFDNKYVDEICVDVEDRNIIDFCKNVFQHTFSSIAETIGESNDETPTESISSLSCKFAASEDRHPITVMLMNMALSSHYITSHVDSIDEHLDNFDNMDMLNDVFGAIIDDEINPEGYQNLVTSIIQEDMEFVTHTIEKLKAEHGNTFIDEDIIKEMIMNAIFNTVSEQIDNHYNTDRECCCDECRSSLTAIDRLLLRPIALQLAELDGKIAAKSQEILSTKQRIFDSEKARTDTFARLSHELTTLQERHASLLKDFNSMRSALVSGRMDAFVDTDTDSIGFSDKLED